MKEVIILIDLFFNYYTMENIIVTLIISITSFLVSFFIDNKILAVEMEQLKKEMEKPAILYITVDEMRWDVLGYAGNSVIKTPNWIDWPTWDTGW